MGNPWQERLSMGSPRYRRIAIRGWSCLRSCGMWRLMDADYCGVAWLVVVALNDVAAFSDAVKGLLFGVA